MPDIHERVSRPYYEEKTPKRKRATVPKPKSIQPLRHLTVSSQAVQRKKHWNGLRNIPFLKLTGVWLEEAGFPIDCKVGVVVENNLLIIKPSGISNQ